MKLLFRLTAGFLLVVALLCGSGITQQAYNLIQGNGTPAARGTTLNLANNTGITWSCTTSGIVTTCTPTLTGGGASFYQTVQTNGTPLTQRPVLNFTTGMTCVDDSGNTSTDCSSSGGPTTNQNLRSISVLFDGGGVALSGTVTRCSQINYAGTINEASIVADQSGNATVDIKTVAYSSYTGPASASSITAATIPALSSAVKFQDSTLTGWTTSLTANTVVCFVLSSPATVTWVAANIRVAAN